MTVPELMKEKLDEYGIEIFNQYSYDGKDYIITDDMMLCYADKKLSIAFQADTIPERVANNILILQEIKELDSEFIIMDSFIHDHKQNLLCGKEAHEMLEYKIGAKYIHEYQRKEEVFRTMLENNICGTA